MTQQPDSGHGALHPTSFWARSLDRDVLVWWEEHGADDAVGGVLTCFDNAGSLLSTEKYTWSQGRWAWLCAEVADASRSGILSNDATRWAQRAGSTAQFLLDYALLPDGSTAFRTDRHGTPLSDHRDSTLSTSVFADLFAVLGIGAAVRIGAQPAEALARAVRVLERAHLQVSARTARTEPYPVPSGYESLAGWMNLLHTSAELLRIPSPEVMPRGVEERIRNVLNGALDHLTGGLEPLVGTGTWWELRADDPAHRDSLLSRHRTPGHMLELLWMLLHAQQVGAQIPPDAVLEELALEALRIGWDHDAGGLLRYSDVDGGRPRGKRSTAPPPYEQLVRDTWDTKLWWVHAEAMYTTALIADRCTSAPLWDWHRRVTDYSLATFPDPERGEWLQIRDRAGAPLDSVVALPVKDPFHIARAFLLLAALPTPTNSPTKEER